MKRTLSLLLILLLLAGCTADPAPAGTQTPPDPTPTPQNCHYDEEWGMWILEREYAGDYALQRVSFPVEKPYDPQAKPVIPAGFRRQEVLDYEGYLAYCDACGLSLAYNDPASHYLVLADTAEGQLVDLTLCDVQWAGETAAVWLRAEPWEATQDAYGYALTVPVPETVRSFTLLPVQVEEEAAQPTRTAWDRDKRTLRVTGEGGYGSLSFPEGSDGALVLELTDDRFQLSIGLSLLRQRVEDPMAFLPAYLDQLDKSLDWVARYMSALAPGRQTAERAALPLELTLRSWSGDSWKNEPDRITIDLSNAYLQHGVLYAFALLDAPVKNWQQIALPYWLGLCLDPYSSMLGESDPAYLEYYYMPAYLRAGGSADTRVPGSYLMMMDACAWYNLVYGMDWPGSSGERQPICEYWLFSGADRTAEANSMSLTMGVSLLNWLARRCGAQMVFAYCYDACGFETAFGMDFDTAKAAWEADLMARFGEALPEPEETPAP